MLTFSKLCMLLPIITSITVIPYTSYQSGLHLNQSAAAKLITVLLTAPRLVCDKGRLVLFHLSLHQMKLWWNISLT